MGMHVFDAEWKYFWHKESTVKSVLRDCSRDQELWPLTTGGLLTQVNYS